MERTPLGVGVGAEGHLACPTHPCTQPRNSGMCAQNEAMLLSEGRGYCNVTPEGFYMCRSKN